MCKSDGAVKNPLTREQKNLLNALNLDDMGFRTGKPIQMLTEKPAQTPTDKPAQISHRTSTFDAFQQKQAKHAENYTLAKQLLTQVSSYEKFIQVLSIELDSLRKMNAQCQNENEALYENYYILQQEQQILRYNNNELQQRIYMLKQQLDKLILPQIEEISTDEADVIESDDESFFVDEIILYPVIPPGTLKRSYAE